MNRENRVLEIQTIQVTAVRYLITALKDILTDATIKFTKEGMKIINFDKTHTILVNCVLGNPNYGNKFEYYRCDPDKIIICANTLQLFKIISMMTNDDTLTIYIDQEDYHDGVVSHLGLQFDDGVKKICNSHKLRLIEPDMEELAIPSVEYSSIFNMPTTIFQKHIRDLYSISDRVEIKTVGDDLYLSIEGSFSKSCIFISASQGITEFKKKPDSSTIIQGEFSLKSLCQFIKCTPLCSHLEMYMENDLPLTVKYDIASLGFIELVIGSLPSV
jgi:proliferating cell nuclear antigen